MKITETRMDKFHKKLTDEDILAYAKNIGELKKKINEAEYAKKNLKNLYREMSEITGILEKGEVSRYMAATFTYHYPEENLVTITPEHITDFPAVVRPMTEIEIERHCEHTIEFEEPEEEESSISDSIDDEAITMLDQVNNDEYYDPGTFVPDTEKDEEDINLGVQITTENEEIQEQEEAILNVDRDKVNIFKSVINNKYFMLDDFGERLYLTIERMSQSQIYFQDPAVQKGTILKDRKDIPLVDLPKKTMAGRTDQIPVYKSLRDGTYFLLDNEGKRLPLEVLIDADTTVTFIDPFDKGQFLVKSPEDIQLRDEEPEQLSKVKVWKALNGGYFVFNEQQNPVPLKVLNSLENVVFLEQEGVEGVILKRHSEIIPSGIYL